MAVPESISRKNPSGYAADCIIVARVSRDRRAPVVVFRRVRQEVPAPTAADRDFPARFPCRFGRPGHTTLSAPRRSSRLHSPGRAFLGNANIVARGQPAVGAAGRAWQRAHRTCNSRARTPSSGTVNPPPAVTGRSSSVSRSVAVFGPSTGRVTLTVPSASCR